jgi:hypothetical protein
MRTTVSLDDRVYAEFKVLAAQSGESVSSVIERAMRRYLLDRDARPSEVLPALPTMRSGGVRPGIDLDDLSRVQEVLDEGRPVDAIR